MKDCNIILSSSSEGLLETNGNTNNKGKNKHLYMRS